MRFVHAGDFHLGATPESSTSWGKERAAAVSSSLLRVIDLCNAEKADLLLIPGDLFNAPPLRAQLREAAYQFSRLEKTRVALIAGNHDYLTSGGIYEDFDFGPNVIFINTKRITSFYIDELNTVIHGFSYYGKELRDPVLDGIKAPQDDRIHVLLAHGGDASHLPIKYSELAASGFDYIALGHIHQPKLFKGTHMAFCGSPEPLDKTDIGPRGCFVGEVTKDGFSIMWHPLAKTQYRRLDIVSDISLTQGALEDTVREELEFHPEDILVVHLSGSREPDFEIDKDAVLALGRVADVIDETTPEYDLDRLLREHDGDIVSYYIQTLGDEDASPATKKALYYGLNALLSEKR